MEVADERVQVRVERGAEKRVVRQTVRLAVRCPIFEPEAN